MCVFIRARMYKIVQGNFEFSAFPMSLPISMLDVAFCKSWRNSEKQQQINTEEKNFQQSTNNPTIWRRERSTSSSVHTPQQLRTARTTAGYVAVHSKQTSTSPSSEPSGSLACPFIQHSREHQPHQVFADLRPLRGETSWKLLNWEESDETPPHASLYIHLAVMMGVLLCSLQ